MRIPGGRRGSHPDGMSSTFIDEAHAEGLKIFTYYWHMSEKSLADPHQRMDLQTTGRRCRSTHQRRGSYLDMTGPYRELVLKRLLELAAMGADGLFFDFRHLPPRGCWDTALAHAWKARTGAPPPAPNDCDPLYQQFLDFKAEQIEETFVYWRDQVKAAIPERRLHRQHDDRSGLDGPRNDDAAGAPRRLSEERVPARAHPKLQQAGFRAPPMSDLRIAARSQKAGRPRTPGARMDGAPRRRRWTPTSHLGSRRAEQRARTGVRRQPAHLRLHRQHGRPRVPPLRKDSRQVIPQGKTPVDALKDAFALGNAVSPHLAGTQPLRWAAIHFGERSRNERGGNFRAAWREVLWPLVGAYQALTEDGVPVGIVNDQQLEHGELDGYRLLVLPNPNGLSHGQQLAVTAFKTNGGTVIENDPAWPWSDPNAGDAAAAAFRAALGRHIKAAPLRVTGGPTGRYAVAYHRPNGWW